MARRVVDGALLHLIKMWLTMAVEETDERGRKRRTTQARDRGRGTPQGAPLSPLLSNLYMRRFLLAWKRLGFEKRLKAFIVNYADDFVICCRGTAEKALAAMRVLMSQLKLTVNESKTRLCQLPDERFDFLGYTIGRCYSWRDGRAYIGTRPSAKRVARLCAALGESCDRRWRWRPVTEQIEHLNRMLIGWSNYFCLGSVSRAYRAVDMHARRWLRQWLRAKYQTATAGRARCSDAYLHEVLGLARLTARTRNFPWAKRVSPSPRAGCGKSARPVR